MNAEYNRLATEATAVRKKLEAQASSQTVRTAAELAAVEEQILLDAVRLSSMLVGKILVRSVECPEVDEDEKQFVDAQPRKFHSQGKTACQN